MNKHPWLKAFLAGIVLYVFASRILFFLGPLGGWAALIAAAILYCRWNAANLHAMTSPVGYGVGMGAVLGAATIEAAIFLNLIISLIVAGSAGASSGTGADGAVLVRVYPGCEGAIRTFDFAGADWAPIPRQAPPHGQCAVWLSGKWALKPLGHCASA